MLEDEDMKVEEKVAESQVVFEYFEEEHCMKLEEKSAEMIA